MKHIDSYGNFRLATNSFNGFLPFVPLDDISATTVDSCHVHSPSPLVTSDQVHGVGSSKSEMETDAADSNWRPMWLLSNWRWMRLLLNWIQT
jgi:hypothetical protein